MVDSFPSNSHTAKPLQEEPPAGKPKIEKIVTGEVQQRKQPLGKRMAETFLGGDAKSVANYVLFDVLVPAAKDMFSDAVSQGFDRMLYGESRPGRRGSRSISEPRGSQISYNRIAPAARREDPRTPISKQARTNHDFDELLLATRPEAELVLERMQDIVDKYDVVSVHDLYEMVGETPSFVDAQWGWDSLLGARAVRDGGGYLLDLPKPKPIK